MTRLIISILKDEGYELHRLTGNHAMDIPRDWEFGDGPEDEEPDEGYLEGLTIVMGTPYQVIQE